MYAGCQQQHPRLWQGLGRAGHAGQSRSPAVQPCQGALRNEHVFRTAGFPLAAPLHIPFTAPRCEADLPCAPRACPAPRIYENKTKAEPGRTGYHESLAGAPQAGLGLSLPRNSPSERRGSSLHRAQRQGALGVSLSPGTAAGTQSPPSCQIPPPPCPGARRGARWIPGCCPALLGVAKLVQAQEYGST